MSKKVEINDCSMCPYFDNEYFGFHETCIKLDRRININSKVNNEYYKIPDDCPLEDWDE